MADAVDDQSWIKSRPLAIYVGFTALHNFAAILWIGVLVAEMATLGRVSISCQKLVLVTGLLSLSALTLWICGLMTRRFHSSSNSSTSDIILLSQLPGCMFNSCLGHSGIFIIAVSMIVVVQRRVSGLPDVDATIHEFTNAMDIAIHVIFLVALLFRFFILPQFRDWRLFNASSASLQIGLYVCFAISLARNFLRQELPGAEEETLLGFWDPKVYAYFAGDAIAARYHSLLLAEFVIRVTGLCSYISVVLKYVAVRDMERPKQD